jgi:hypothetical protein
MSTLHDETENFRHKDCNIVVMNRATHPFTMYDTALKTFLEGENRIDLLQDTDRLEDFLLEIENFEISHNQNDYIILTSITSANVF